VNKPIISILPADLSNEEICSRVVEDAAKIMGGIDLLVLNHITTSRYGLWTQNTNYSFIGEMYNVNALSYIWMATSATKYLKNSNGQIIVVSSFAGNIKIILTYVYVCVCNTTYDTILYTYQCIRTHWSSIHSIIFFY
jgi:short-subunit dehydrogenase